MQKLNKVPRLVTTDRFIEDGVVHSEDLIGLMGMNPHPVVMVRMVNHEDSVITDQYGTGMSVEAIIAGTVTAKAHAAINAVLCHAWWYASNHAVPALAPYWDCDACGGKHVGGVTCHAGLPLIDITGEEMFDPDIEEKARVKGGRWLR